MEHESTVHSHGKSGKPQTGLHGDWGQKGGVTSALYSGLGSPVPVQPPNPLLHPEQESVAETHRRCGRAP